MLVVARGDVAIVLQATEHALDGVMTAVDYWAEAGLPDAGAFRPNVWHSTLCLDVLTDGVGVLGAVSHDQDLVRQVLQQCPERSTVCGLAASEREGDRAASPSVRAWILVVRLPRLMPIA